MNKQKKNITIRLLELQIDMYKNLLPLVNDESKTRIKDTIAKMYVVCERINEVVDLLSRTGDFDEN